METDKKEAKEEKKKEVKEKFCKKCGNVIPKDLPRYSARKFCSKKCCSMAAALDYYHRIKESDDYKAYRKVYYKKWFEENRASVRKRNALEQKEQKPVQQQPKKYSREEIEKIVLRRNLNGRL